ncbi:retinol dehydrogenase 13 [Trichuris trichiura]|uniref:Retinol dehydrogenase 13 n=1 Tax=Trichuris trichiura TaxID=36087 RepID=A0A077YXI7_TRITR|nr:retinol dehydrogenase 13 [Trichuris trichiura]
MSLTRRILRSPLFLSSCGAAVVLGGAVFYKESISCCYKVDSKLDNVVAVVTGATNGIGLATTRKLAEAGARVIMASRNMDKCKEQRRKIVLETRNKNVVCRLCDLASLESVENFAKRIIQDKEKVNLLINNAGIMHVPPKPTVDGFEPHLGVNFLGSKRMLLHRDDKKRYMFVGPHLLTVLLLDQLKVSAPSRIVNMIDISCKRGHVNFQDLNSTKDKPQPQCVYDQSQLARVVCTRELSRQLKGKHLHTYKYVKRTGIGRQVKSKFVKVVTWPAKKIGLQAPDKAANAVLLLAVSPEFGDVSGKTFRYDRVTKTLKETEINDEAEDLRVQLRLWLTADYWTKAQKVQLLFLSLFSR